MSNYDDFNIQLDHDVAIDQEKAQNKATGSPEKAKNGSN